ncbi:DUF3667 domain-containing protein [Dokdonella soli]|uniref:DUF3667 domain-containing protein n=1 Tax=Dokdonella soli TaxID=529810 RepID=A0ABN1J0H8_9GAMM
MTSESAQPATATEAPTAPPATARATKACANCGAPMHGPFCYACGQPEKGMIRHLASVLADAADTIFNVDSRIFRSIFPLYFQPGYLTTEYFVGRRTRYVTPFRLFFFLCVISFFAIQASLNVGDFHFNLGDDEGSIDHAQNEADLQKRTQKALEGIESAKSAPNMPASAQAGLQKAIDAVRRKSDKRLAYLKASDEAKAKGLTPPPDPNDDETLSFDGKPWDPVAHPVRVAWLPVFANTKLNEAIGHAKDNIIAAKRDPRHLVAGVFSVLPQTLFALMPLFAVLLKIAYLFKRRLYMEHLMVALHSHAFICLSLLLVAIAQLLLGWAATDAQWLLSPLRLARGLIWTWIPIYLLLMQKRVYKQGWFMTTLKYGFVGFCYVMMLAWGLAAALVVSLAIT